MRRNWTKCVLALNTLAILFTVSGCQDIEFEDTPTQYEVGIYAGGAQTRTEMLPDGLGTVWAPDDQLAVWARNSSGAYFLSNQIFSSYGIDGNHGYFTATLSSPMPADTYTYMCSYPAPVSVSGTRATFLLPTQQDGKAGGGADIMIATPVQGQALNAMNDKDVPYNPVSLQMNRLTHQFRFWIPIGENNLGEDIKKIEITMPRKIAGNLVANLQSPLQNLDLSNGTSTITLDLLEPLGESDYNGKSGEADFAYAVIFPDLNPDNVYGDSDFMNITVYGNSGKSTLDPISLSGRAFLPGHSTPVRLLPKEPDVYCSLNIKTGQNNIGEALWSITISSEGEQLFKYNNTSGTYHNIDYTKEFNGTEGKAEFDAIVNAVAAGKAVLNFETNHASVDIQMPPDMLKKNGNNASLNLGDVPYLLYEDFSNAPAYAKNDTYKATTDSDIGTDGFLLNSYLSQNGWNASRFGIIQEDCIRINCRYEGAVFAYRKYCGRLDTPALKYLKQGASVDVVIEYDRAISIPPGYNLDTSGAKAKYYVGYHNKSENSTYGAIGIGNTSESNITGDATIVHNAGPYASENVGNMTTETITIPSATNQTRMVFYVNTTESKIVFLGMNSCYYLYLDNIKVYIKSN